MEAIVTRTSQSQDLNINGARLTSNTWRDTSAIKSGNTYQWKYQVSAKYNGGAAVERIRTTWV